MTTERHASIVFVLGQAQNIILDSLISDIGNSDVFIFTVYPLECSGNIRPINIKPSTAKEFFLMLFSMWWVLLKLKRCTSVDIYAPHILNFMANKFYKKLSGKCKVYYLFDGILNYRSVRADAGRILEYQKKQALKSLLIFHRYMKCTGEMVNQDLPGAAGLYVPSGVLVDKINFSKPIYRLETRVNNFTPEKKILILEPPLGYAEARFFEKKLLQLVESKFSKFEIFLKIHPSMRETNINTSLFHERGFDLHFLTENKPAESIYQDLKCSVVVSTNSSALLMIKVNYPASEVFSITSGPQSDGSLLEIESIMREAGIIFV